MGDYKGTGIAFLRDFVRSQGDAVEQKMLARLSLEDQQLYRTTVPVSWVSILAVNRLFEAAAPLIHPTFNEGLRAIGAEMARNNLAGIYRTVIRVMNVTMLLKSSAQLWGTYHSRGAAAVEGSIGNGPIGFVVSDYPDLPESFREATCGYIQAAVEFTGVEDVRVTKSERHGGIWAWEVRYGSIPDVTEATN